MGVALCSKGCGGHLQALLLTSVDDILLMVDSPNDGVGRERRIVRVHLNERLELGIMFTQSI
jgi:hypothetical protein